MNKVGQRGNLDRNLPVTLWALELLHTLLNNLLCQQRNSHCFYNIKNKNKNPYKFYKYIIKIVIEKVKMLEEDRERERVTGL